jgi:hypothetical protein
MEWNYLKTLVKIIFMDYLRVEPVSLPPGVVFLVIAWIGLGSALTVLAAVRLLGHG